MATSILDLIKSQVAAQAGNVEIPANAKDKHVWSTGDQKIGGIKNE